ncbi:PAS domain-containing sensor histidine kinase [Sulfurospirillum sp. 1612]|uniref:PAS domain-containing sensor histidine kinase n=1 Tax=Sulfurospirillum sp. 1612 TaxID=3094835 RepID=UPI002F927CFD
MTLEQYKNAIETSNIVSKTDLNGMITFVNDEFCRIFEYSREELIGKNHNIVRHPDVDASVFKALWDTILAKKTYKSTVKNLSKSGKTIYVNTTVIPILDKNGAIEEFIAIRYDVTRKEELTKELQKKERELENLNATLEERIAIQTQELQLLNRDLEKRVEEEVCKNREKDRLLFQQSRLASMGEMIGNIAHQWRQPLSELSITLYKTKKIYMSQTENLSDHDTFLSSYNHAKDVIKKMSKTIEDFRHFFNPNRAREHFLIKDAVDEMLRIMKETVHKHHLHIKVTYKKNISIDGFISEFTQVLMNLLNNSKDAFESKHVTQREIALVIDSDEQSNAVITYHDNAGGIKEDIIDKIFDPYFTTKHSSVGTGLGLYMSRMIIKDSMDGDMSVTNNDHGAQFTIIVPQRRKNE